MVLWFGWLVVRVARPRTTATMIAFAVAVAAVATICQVVFTAPILIEQSHYEIVEGKNRLHPVGDAEPDDRWLAESARPGTPEHAEAEYLKQFLPSDERDRWHPESKEHMRKLRIEAAQVNRLQAGYHFARRGAGTNRGTILWAIFSSWVVMFLDRSRGRSWWNLVRYAELSVARLFYRGRFLVVGYVTELADRAFLGACRLRGGDHCGCVGWDRPTLALVGSVGLYMGVTVMFAVVAVAIAIAYDEND